MFTTTGEKNSLLPGLDVRFASHTIIKDSNSEFALLDEEVKIYIPEFCFRLMLTVEIFCIHGFEILVMALRTIMCL